jgi:pimeloyl-ACP methyl ester carboxylesterase
MTNMLPITMVLLLAGMLCTTVNSSSFVTAFHTGTPITKNIIASKSARFASIIETKIELSTGITAQVLSSNPANPTQQPPLVFVHGSFHAAWCWTEYYFPYFVELGYPVAALSLRGTGGTFAGPGIKKVKIEDHAKDLQSFLQQLSHVVNSNTKPILISHSFGGLAVMKHLEMHDAAANDLSGVVTMCSVPPSGNGPMTLRYLRRSLVDAWKITAGFAMKKAIRDEGLCRDLFFGGQVSPDGNKDDFGVSSQDVERYQSYFERDTEAIIDLGDLVQRLPSKQAMDGRAPHLETFPPCLVVGANRDFIVDRVALEETSTYFGVDAPTIVDSPHDVMLGRNWKNGADAIDRFVQDRMVISLRPHAAS